jgi:cytoskeleton protein RodZ
MANQRGKTRSRPWHEGGEETVSFGTWLRRQREVRDISLREIADASKIGLRYLEAFEQDRFDALPAVVFAKGFLREYSKYVGLDADEVINHFLAAYEANRPESPEETGVKAVAEPSNQWLYNLLLFVAVGAILVLIALVAFKAERKRAEQPTAPAAVSPQATASPSPASEFAPSTVPATEAVPEPAPEASPETAGSIQPPTTEPAATEPATTEAAAEPVPVAEPPSPEPAPALAPSTAPVLVTLDFIDNCWVEARVDGTRRASQEFARGESVRLEAQEAVELTLGNAAGVRILVNGRPYQVDAPAGKVLRNLRIDLALLRSLGAP